MRNSQSNTATFRHENASSLSILIGRKTKAPADAGIAGRGLDPENLSGLRRKPDRKFLPANHYASVNALHETLYKLFTD